MYAPRRYTHRLLLPPGWVALGFLLLLGCQALQTHRWQMKVDYKLELPMPILERVAAKYPVGDIMRKFSKPLSQVRRETHWHTVHFNGGKLNHFINNAVITNAVRSMQAEAANASGVRVCFQPGTTYAELVNLVDLMNRLSQRRYWLDI